MSAIRLEPFSTSHLGAISALLTDADVLRYTRVPDPPPPDFGEHWLARYEAGRLEGTREAFAIADAETGEFFGLAVAPEIDATAQTVELGYIVAPAARGRGIASEALRLLTDWALAELGALRLELLISCDNEASKRVAERCGYEREGVLRSLYFKQGVRQDTEIWSRLAVVG